MSDEKNKDLSRKLWRSWSNYRWWQARCVDKFGCKLHLNHDHLFEEAQRELSAGYAGHAYKRFVASW
jgi:hypothetical protein